MLQAAQDATGADSSQLTVEALREQLPAVVKMLNERRGKAFEEFMQSFGNDGNAPQDMKGHEDQLEGMRKKLKK